VYTTPCLRIGGTSCRRFVVAPCWAGMPVLRQQPIRPVVSVTPLEEAVLVAWDSLAEKSPLIRSTGTVCIAPGSTMSLRTDQGMARIVHRPAVRSFLDVGDDNADGSVSGTEGLHNELTYYYTVSAFADSVVQPFRPASETFSDTLLAIPRTVRQTIPPTRLR